MPTIDRLSTLTNIGQLSWINIQWEFTCQLYKFCVGITCCKCQNGQTQNGANYKQRQTKQRRRDKKRSRVKPRHCSVRVKSWRGKKKRGGLLWERIPWKLCMSHQLRDWLKTTVAASFLLGWLSSYSSWNELSLHWLEVTASSIFSYFIWLMHIVFYQASSLH